MLEVETIIGKFATAALRVKSAGFDFVEFHNSHGHLPRQFFSPADNNRTDRYGSDLSGRLRFGLDCVRAIRTEVGDGYPIFVRLAAGDDRPSGITLADSTVFAAELEKATADVIDVSVGLTIHSRGYFNKLRPTGKFPMGTLAHLVEVIRHKVSVPAVAVGRINQPEVAGVILVSGKANLIADPFWPRMVADGRSVGIVECDSCNHCFRGL